MARVFQDGFEFGVPTFATYVTEGYGGSPWLCQCAGANIGAVTSLKNSGNYSLYLGELSFDRHPVYARTVLPNLSEVYCRCEVYFGTLTSDLTHNFFSFRDTSNAIIQLGWLNSNLIVTVLGTVVATGVSLLPQSTWLRLEVHLKMETELNGGIVEIKINGNNTITYNGNTKGAYTQIDRLYLGSPEAASGFSVHYQFYFDDVAVNDITGSVNNTWCGKGSVLRLKPKADGFHTDWTPNSGADHFNRVNQTVPDGDTTYITTDTQDNIDSFDMEELVANLGIDPASVVKAVQLVASARYEGSDAELAGMIRIGSTDYEAATPVILGSAYKTEQLKIWDQNPATSANWTLAGVDGLEAGIIHKDFTH